MAYASVQDMIVKFGEEEMIRLTTPDGEPMTAVRSYPVEDALNFAASFIDTYLRKRYRVPLDLVPSEVARATIMLARYELSIGGQKTVSDETKMARQEAVSWLRDVADGRVWLDLEEVTADGSSGAEVSVRQGRSW